MIRSGAAHWSSPGVSVGVARRGRSGRGGGVLPADLAVEHHGHDHPEDLRRDEKHVRGEDRKNISGSLNLKIYIYIFNSFTFALV